MQIRQERPDDHIAIAAVTAAAFAGVAHSDQSEPQIIARLRAAGALTISLVAIDDDDCVAGHIAFSRVTIDGADRGWFGLGPVAVRPDRQGEGIGAALIGHGLGQLRACGAAGCVVLSDPAYYRRFGFEHDPGLRYEGAPADYFMRMTLAGTAVPGGRVDYAPAFTA